MALLFHLFFLSFSVSPFLLLLQTHCHFLLSTIYFPFLLFSISSFSFSLFLPLFLFFILVSFAIPFRLLYSAIFTGSLFLLLRLSLCISLFLSPILPILFFCRPFYVFISLPFTLSPSFVSLSVSLRFHLLSLFLFASPLLFLSLSLRHHLSLSAAPFRPFSPALHHSGFDGVWREFQACAYGLIQIPGRVFLF